MGLEPSQLAAGNKVRYNYGDENSSEFVEGTPFATVATNVGPVVILRSGTDFAFATEAELLTHGEAVDESQPQPQAQPQLQSQQPPQQPPQQQQPAGQTTPAPQPGGIA